MGIVKNLEAVQQQERSSDRPTEIRGEGDSIRSDDVSSKMDSHHSSLEESSQSSPSSSSNPSSTTTNKDGIIVSNQERNILGARCFFLALLLCAAAALATTVYMITKNGEEDDFTVSVSFVKKDGSNNTWIFPWSRLDILMDRYLIRCTAAYCYVSNLPRHVV
jgi:hypothetical protein